MHYESPERLAIDFHTLLERVGAQPPRYSRGRWGCPRCEAGKTPVLSVDLDREVFYCHRCQWKGGRRSIELDLGLPQQQYSRAEVQRHRAVLAEAAKFRAWWRARLNFLREFLWILNDVERNCAAIGADCIANAQTIPDWVFAELKSVDAQRTELEVEYALFSDPDRNAATLFTEYRRGKQEVAA